MTDERESFLPHRIKVLTDKELLTREFAPLEFVLTPILPSSSRLLLYAAAGIGKTHFGLGIGCACASGGTFGPWKGVSPKKVLYIDGEMGTRLIRQRFEALVRYSQFDIPEGFFRFLCFDECQNSLPPNIADPIQQRQLETFTEWADVIIFDNWCCLRRPFEKKRTDFELWPLFHAWNIKLTSKGKTTILIHHAGKSGVYLGTSEMTQAMDVILKLTRPHNYESREGAKFEVHFDKARHLVGDEVEPLLCQYRCNDISLSWSFSTLKDELPRRIEELRALGMKDKAIIGELKITEYQLRKATITDPVITDYHDEKDF